jgi:ATP-binding cassette, subfamily B, bacterial
MEKVNQSNKSLFLRLKEQEINWRRSFQLIWAASPFHTASWGVLLIIQGILPGLLVYLTKLVVDSLVVAVNSQGDWEKVRPAVFFIVVTGVVMLASDVIQSLLEMVRTVQVDLIQDYVKNLVHQKAATVDIAHFESPEYHDRLEQATSDGANRPLSLLESIGGLVQNSITLIVVAGLLIQYTVWLPLILLISTLPAFFIVLRYDREYNRWWRKTTSDRRWIHYFDVLLTHRATIAEVRAFDLSPQFQSRYQDLRKRLRTEKLEQMRRLGIAKLLTGVLSLGILGAAVGWMGWRTFAGALTLGDLALFYQAFNRGQGLMRSLLSSLGQIIKNSLFLTALFEFLDLKSNVTDPETPVETPPSLKEGIRFRNVSFRYPGTERYVLRDFSLFIPAGKSVAIVGVNGSGKTTLTRLICRFYDPESGSVEFDGIDIKRFSVKNLLRMITNTFQMPLNFHAPANESIAMGDVAASASAAEIENAARSAGAHDFISQLPKKYDTLLGRGHGDGTELSGGEWQRLALARAYFRKAPIVLLDEPTSAMDSWAEADWFRRFRELTKNLTAVLITHRFTIAMRADIIFVMHKGEVIESGTHAELLKLNGHYAKSWKEQMQAALETAEDAETFYTVPKNGNALEAIESNSL